MERWALVVHASLCPFQIGGTACASETEDVRQKETCLEEYEIVILYFSLLVVSHQLWEVREQGWNDKQT